MGPAWQSEFMFSNLMDWKLNDSILFLIYLIPVYWVPV